MIEDLEASREITHWLMATGLLPEFAVAQLSALATAVSRLRGSHGVATAYSLLYQFSPIETLAGWTLPVF